MIDDIEAAMRELVELYGRDDLAGALSQAEEVLLADPDNPLALLVKGVIAEREGRHLGARELLERAVSVAPEYGDAHNSLGIVLFRLGQAEEAGRRFARAMALSPKDSRPRTNLANLRRVEGRVAEARSLYEKAIALNGGDIEALTNLAMLALEEKKFAEARALTEKAYAAHESALTCYALGVVALKQDDLATATRLLARAVELDPRDRRGAGLRLAAIGAAALPERASPDHVAQLFDGMADGYDKWLVDRLRYSGPAAVAEALDSVRPDRKLRILDLGCGTGLSGQALRAKASVLEGVDLSSRMVRIAEARRVYDRLEVGDLLTTLERHEGSWDALTAVDVFVYHGDLEGPLRACRRALAPGGVLVFTLEEADPQALTSGATYLIQSTGRFAHAQASMEPLLTATGFRTTLMESISIRKEEGKPSPGLVIVAEVSP